MLSKLLEESDGDALDCLTTHTGPIRVELGPEDFQRLETLVNMFDFKSALNLLRERRIEGSTPDQ